MAKDGWQEMESYAGRDRLFGLVDIFLIFANLLGRDRSEAVVHAVDARSQSHD